MKSAIRQPVVVVLGHVDSGKTSLLDKIRGTAVQEREAGGITQHIGASFFPTETLMKMCGHLLRTFKGDIEVPGILVIDTPGHEAFTNLRSRGGSASDISILVVDAMKGFEVQTRESVDILKSRKVPFIIALNKIDMITGWREIDETNLLKVMAKQEKQVSDYLDGRIYTVVGSLSKLGFQSESFQRVKDFTQEVAVVPVSAKTGLGIPELMSVLIGLTQQFLHKKLIMTKGIGRGIVLEVKEEVGLGHTANVILLNGTLRVSDTIVLGKREGAFVTKVKAIFMPKPLDEMRDPRDKFLPVDEVHAAAGFKVVTTDLEGVLAGSPLLGVKDPNLIENAKHKVEDEFTGLFKETDANGVVVKCDTLGSLEAILDILERKDVPVRLADIGPVTRRDVVEALTVKEKDDLLGVVLAFGVKTLPNAFDEASTRNVKIFTDQIIYSLLDNYLGWADQERNARLQKGISDITPPCRFKVLKGLIFRRSSPAVFGVEVQLGKLRQHVTVMNSHGETIGSMRQIQDQGKNITEVQFGTQVAVSMNEPTVGRQVNEDELLYAMPTNDEVKLLQTKYMTKLSEDELEALNEIVIIRRKVSPEYGF